MAKNYKELVAWRKAMLLATDVYRLTCSFPREERFALTDQVRRAAVSVASNIAEGAGRGSRREFRHFLSIARGSLLEIETQLLIARELKYAALPDLEHVLSEVTEVLRIVSGLRASMNTEPDTTNYELPTTNS
jgi:four helix bundle protein